MLASKANPDATRNGAILKVNDGLRSSPLLMSAGSAPVRAQQTPHLEKRDGHFAMVVDGKPFLILGAQINNSSSWPAHFQRPGRPSKISTSTP